jgi:O-methyltransferase
MVSLNKKILSFFRLAGLFFSSPKVYQTILKARREKLTFLGFPALIDLAEVVQSIETHGIQGDFIEAGCALGGSALVIASAKNQNRIFSIYDTFEMIPPPSSKDDEDVHHRYQKIISGQAQGIKGDAYYGYLPDLYDRVRLSFDRFSIPLQTNHVQLVKGLFQDTLNPELSIAFAHIDCDWYESVLTCLQRIEPLLVTGGVLVIDDYDDWTGCKKAVDEYFKGRLDHYQFTKKARLQIQRKK